MGPHPETPVDVQKYIGSCLITQQPRSKRKSCPRAQLHPKDGRCNGYIPKSSGGFSNMTNYAWTGVPLISVARQGGKSHHPGQNRSTNSSGTDYGRVDSPVDVEEILPMSRLAIHAQGAPLILSHKDSEKKDVVESSYSNIPTFKGHDFYLGEGNSNSRLYMLMQGCSDDTVSSHHVRGVRTSSGSSNCFVEDDVEVANSRAVASSPSQSDCISTTSEDSCMSENGLPRIIKPRKRRKKDRRFSEGENNAGQVESAGSIVTLKPYQPLCFRYGYKAFSSTYKSSKSSLSSEDDSGQKKGIYPYSPSPRCRCPYCVPPPSTLLTPPDSPVAEDSLLAVANRLGDKFLTMPENLPNLGLEDSIIKSQNAPVFTTENLPTRPWITVSPVSRQSACKLIVMSYNVLCDKYATRQMYGYCPNWALNWNYRKRHIMNEILHYRADIICLQEVETEQFEEFFLPELKREGYDGVFCPKSRAKTMNDEDKKHVDGCAIFYKTAKFFILGKRVIEFNQLAMDNSEGSAEMINRVMTKDNVALAVLLQTRLGAYDMGVGAKPCSQTVLVSTAHIHWDPKFSDVKLIQTMMLMHELKLFIDTALQKCNIPPYQKVEPNVIPLLLCGDFNSLPDSGVVEYLEEGRVSIFHSDFREILYTNCLSNLSSTPNEFLHPFQIARAYNDSIMPFTNYSYDFKGVIDYIFYSQLHMNVLGVLGAVDSEWLEENHIHGCPHPHIPSDHFPIVVELQLFPTLPIYPTPNNGFVFPIYQ